MIRRAMLKGHVEGPCWKTCGPSTSRRMWRRTMARPKSASNRQAAEKLDRCPHDKARELWGVAEAPQNDRMHLWLGQAAWHDAQGEASRGCSYRRRIFAEPHRLQPDPHPEIGCRINRCSARRQATSRSSGAAGAIWRLLPLAEGIFRQRRLRGGDHLLEKQTVRSALFRDSPRP